MLTPSGHSCMYCRNSGTENLLKACRRCSKLSLPTLVPRIVVADLACAESAVNCCLRVLMHPTRAGLCGIGRQTCASELARVTYPWRADCCEKRSTKHASSCITDLGCMPQDIVQDDCSRCRSLHFMSSFFSQHSLTNSLEKLLDMKTNKSIVLGSTC